MSLGEEETKTLLASRMNVSLLLMRLVDDEPIGKRSRRRGRLEGLVGDELMMD